MIRLSEPSPCKLETLVICHEAAHHFSFFPFHLLNSFPFVPLICVNVYALVHVRRYKHMCVGAHMWKSEDNLGV